MAGGEGVGCMHYCREGLSQQEGVSQGGCLGRVQRMGSKTEKVWTQAKSFVGDLARQMHRLHSWKL